MCFGCLVFSGEGNLPDWQTWTDHPVRKEYDIIMDLGEGAFSQVSPSCQIADKVYVHDFITSCRSHMDSWHSVHAAMS